ncbi:MAG: SDR family oxidoreductase [Gemella sp.]|nr:SDR family oxidoreductase [Gemella sp.]
MEKEFSNKIVVVTGGAKGIGRQIANDFLAQGATVEIIDILDGDHFVGDISKEEILDDFCQMVIDKHGKVDVLVNNAIPIMKGIEEATYDDFIYAMKVGAAAPFYLAKKFAPYFNQGAAIINISSSRSQMSQAQTETYSAAKGAIASLTHAMAMSFAGKVRVNAIAPGWIETSDVIYDDENASQHPAGRVGKTSDISNMVLYLSSDKASFITGQEFLIDGGMGKQMIYHDDNGWLYKKSK